MIPELGHFALILALLLAALLATLPIVGAQRGVAVWMALARPLATDSSCSSPSRSAASPTRSSPTTSPC